VRSIDHKLSLGKRAPPAAGKVSVDILIAVTREEAWRIHVRVFGLHKEAGDVSMDLRGKYFGQAVGTNDRLDLSIHQRNCDFLDLIHNVVSTIPTLDEPLAVLVHGFVAQLIPFRGAAMLDGLRP
jgi:hypothetical protein